MSMSHNNSNISVYLQAGRFVTAFMDVLNKSYPDLMAQTSWLYADTLEEARAMAQEQVDKLHAQLPASDPTDTETQESTIDDEEDTKDA
jgi:hypothetical protein